MKSIKVYINGDLVGYCEKVEITLSSEEMIGIEKAEIIGFEKPLD